MRILLVTDWLRLHGGMETYFATLRTGLRAAGHDARLLTSTAGSAAEGTAEYRAYGSNAQAAQALLQIANPFAFAGIRTAVRDLEPDLAIVGMVEQHLSPTVFSALRGVSTVFSVGDYKPICPISTKLLPDGSLCREPAGAVCWRGGCVSLPHWLRDRPRYALLRSGIERADRVVACSSWLQKALAEEGVTAETLLLPTLPPSPGFVRTPTRHPLFAFVGRLSVEKGVESLLRAFARVREAIPDAELRLVGDGPERSALERLADSVGLGASVVFRGWLSPPEIERELAVAWASVAPSVWAEPLGLVAAEAVVHGVPVVASATGGLPEIVDHGRSGLLFPAGDETALARCLENVATGRAFPDHVVPTEVVEEVSAQHDLAAHVTRIEQIHAEIAIAS